MATIRQPAVAGMFYPAEPEELRRTVLSFLHAAKTRLTAAPKAIVAPHAGYIYSGPVAGSAYAQLSEHADGISRVLLLGPSHRVPYRGLAYSSAASFQTPLGTVPVDQGAFERVKDLRQVREYEAPFEGEHCLEVQLPFLQLVLKDFCIVPFLVGDASAEEVADVIERLWGGTETLIVISSDLSHYLDYESAKAIDAETSRAIEALNPSSISHHQACGRNPLNGLLREAKRHGLHARTLDLRNSGDTAGPRNQVVGYGAYAFA
ncbi:MAG: AmmeMemoRadiSam system protein B [Pseudomonadota bacterium]|nr:AmmeMemoRadiSam system protein B [Pseudomonadota bacterium]